jgi:hypothetical protein
VVFGAQPEMPRTSNRKADNASNLSLERNCILPVSNFLSKPRPLAVRFEMALPLSASDGARKFEIRISKS